MTELFIYGERATSIFDPLGSSENSITSAIGVALSRIDPFLEEFLRIVNVDSLGNSKSISVKLQNHEASRGFTDIEIEQDGHFSIIIEAKKGWMYPCQSQLDKYSSRAAFQNADTIHKIIIVLSECSAEFSKENFEIKSSNGYKVLPISYKQIWSALRRSFSKCNNVQKFLSYELEKFLERLMTMQNQLSNMVYVVSLSYGTNDGWGISWIDIVKERRKYFHPIGGGWPSDPPNYIAFRYYGELQSIHHVESYEVMANPNSVFPEIPDLQWNKHYLYHLGTPIIPAKTIKTGKIFRSGRVWAMLDLLMTSETISEAREKTQERLCVAA